jgi:acyl carrier protein
MTVNLMTYEEFRQFLSDTLGVAKHALRPDTNLLFELGVESLKIVELMLQFEKRLGMQMTSDTAWDIGTVDDAYRFYVDQVRSDNGKQ